MGRIIAGVAGGLSLASVPGTATRPTTDRVKEALFSRLEAWDVLAEARVLDLFAGSGGLGIEAASRGARSVVLVDQAEAAVKVCRANAKTANQAIGKDVVSVHRANAKTVLEATTIGSSFTLVFLDPPYPMTEDELGEILERLAPRLEPEATIVVERSRRSPEPQWAAGMELLTEKKYGEARVWFADYDDAAR
ncbi:16S rRNA (guanine(966)-N(2))-methyltransferase RsmD [Neomicrococcus aestuarii]|uniref:16S rRNA (Guanine(966)-N(2))-methyltransferase RsmD n=1 Tax=Neomicrococcus aestuarii TaxID=556325 RepID=A0A1L2ZKP2_9MICC|nr:16S rRNA (guanine(966)-N(2))-methyltransferase RsmD [Neomicrococcus aestuarii]APF39924.1 16S rRNA (guanine(966)-N(2))-methyltransferase RsmD [Neomicrococcus aestuarii]